MAQRYAQGTSGTQARHYEASFAESEDETDTQERELRSQVQMTLRNEAAYHRDQFEDIMTALQRLGVRSIAHFKYLQKEDLIAQGIPLVAALILIRKFGDEDRNANSKKDDSSQEVKSKSGWEKFMEFLDHRVVQTVVSFGLDILKLFATSWLANSFNPRRALRK
ncbi:uncharacterized protein LOC144168816 isoform X2 [Haemaphysalis longicornis]